MVDSVDEIQVLTVILSTLLYLKVTIKCWETFVLDFFFSPLYKIIKILLLYSSRSLYIKTLLYKPLSNTVIFVSDIK